MAGPHHFPHVLGTKTHKPIDPTSPTSPTSPRSTNKKMAKQIGELHKKAQQPHVHYEKAAREAEKQKQRNDEQMSESTREAALAAARGVSEQQR